MAPSIPCLEDPTKSVGDAWMCDDGCNTCSSDLNGHVLASGCVRDVVSAPETNHAEEITVAIAATVVIACLACFVVLCCVMCRDRNNQGLFKASELEGADEDDD